MIVIADTSAVNYLVSIEQIAVLEKIYGTVVIPDSVREELLRPTAPEVVRRWIADPPRWLLVRSPAAKSDPSLSDLDAGERDAITLALELGAERLIIDERRGRAVARERGVRVIGTLGVLKIASGLGLLDLRAAVARLQSAGFYISASILRDLFKD